MNNKIERVLIAAATLVVVSIVTKGISSFKNKKVIKENQEKCDDIQEMEEA